MKGLKVSNFDPNRGVLVGTGLTSGGAAGGSVASVTDGTITVTGVHSFVFPTSEVTELASGVAQIVVGLAGTLTHAQRAAAHAVALRLYR